MKGILFTIIFLIGNVLIFAQETPSDTIVNQTADYNIADSITDKSIVYPESMTEDLSELLRAWQIDLSSSEEECERGVNVVFHDTVYANRLYSLPTEMELSYNQVVKSYIEMYSGRRRDQVSYMLALGDYYFPMFEEALDRHGLPLELKYLPVIESALNPIAVSRAGATGLWQFMLRTGKGYGLEINSLLDERRDPYKSTEAAVRYLKDLYAIYGDWNLVIAAYNCGPGNVNKAIARSGGKRDYWEIYYRLPKETRGYVPAFIAANYIMNYYTDHKICPVHSFGSSVALDTVHVKEPIHFEQISAVLDIPVSEIKRLNPQFKKDRIPSDNKSYVLVLPSENMYAYIEHNDSIVNYDRNNYFTHRMYTDGFINGTSSLSDGNSTNVYYKVRSGDNLSAIARRNGTTVARIKSWNGLSSDRLSIGKQLIVGKAPAPAPAPSSNDNVQLAQAGSGSNSETINKYYRVRKGDTLGEIARENNVAVAQLRSWNSLRSTRINIGDQLIVGQTVKAVPEVEDKETDNAVKKVESENGSGSNIISDYLNKQLSNIKEDETEAEAVVTETASDEYNTSESSITGEIQSEEVVSAVAKTESSESVPAAK